MTIKSIRRIFTISCFFNVPLSVLLIYQFVWSLFKSGNNSYTIISLAELLLYISSNIILAVIMKNLHLEEEQLLGMYQNGEKLNDLIIKNTPSGLVILSNKGIIEYLNPAIIKILGSNEALGQNILDIDSIKNNFIYRNILSALAGKSSVMFGLNYVTNITKENRVINTYIDAVVNENKVSKVIIHIHDVTKEVELKNEIESTFLSTIEALAESIDAKDTYTGRHSSNVLKYTSKMCEALEIDDKHKENIKIAATIHDIGKIGITDNILKKPDKLTNEEYEIMKDHPVIGSSIVGKIHGYKKISNIIKYHHERWDGRGYPEGIKEDEIPLGAQIIAIADAFDAMTSNRVYRKSLGYERAVQILIEEKGRQFNSELVELFIDMLENSGEELLEIG